MIDSMSSEHLFQSASQINLFYKSPDIDQNIKNNSNIDNNDLSYEQLMELFSSTTDSISSTYSQHDQYTYKVNNYIH